MNRTCFGKRLVTLVGLIAAFVTGAAGAQAATSTASSDVKPGALNGVYRITWTKEQLIAAGMSRDHAANDTLTLTLHDGRFRLQIKAEPALR